MAEAEGKSWVFFRMNFAARTAGELILFSDLPVMEVNSKANVCNFALLIK